MIHHIFNSKGVSESGLTLVRSITGILLIVHGTQAFEAEDMKGYAQWLGELHYPFPAFMAYAGKSTEFLGGICLVLGLFTRVATGMLILLFTQITFMMGSGKFLTDDQHPFLFVLLASVFFFGGAGKWSLDRRFFDIQRGNL